MWWMKVKQIVDGFHFRRIMEGRRYSDRSSTSNRRKEGMKWKTSLHKWATTTTKLLRMYRKLSGMSQVLLWIPEEEELREIQHERYCNPVNTQRIDGHDLIYHHYVVIAITKISNNVMKQVNQSCRYGCFLFRNKWIAKHVTCRRKFRHEVINAKPLKEAEIIMSAGQRGAVTIAKYKHGRTWYWHQAW